MAVKSIHFLSCILLLSLSTATAVDCVYNILVDTGTETHAGLGTNSTVSLTLYDQDNPVVEIPDLKAVGIKKGGENYFEAGKLDIFSVVGNCSTSLPTCAMNLTVDGSVITSWYVNYVAVSINKILGDHSCLRVHFTVNQWLANDRVPIVLSAIRSLCQHIFMKDSSGYVASI